jgi:hypothetical protein
MPYSKVITEHNTGDIPGFTMHLSASEFYKNHVKIQSISKSPNNNKYRLRPVIICR